jgi:hypothetical protein
MRSFIIACIAAVVIAAIGAMILNFVQEPVDVAFATEAARILLCENRLTYRRRLSEGPQRPKQLRL